MLAIGLDTSVPHGSVGLAGSAPGRDVVTRAVEAAYCETLLPALSDLLEGEGYSLASIDLIAVAVGPGTFTGLRIGLATAKGLALALGRPLAGFSSLESAARACLADRRSVNPAGRAICVLQDAGRGEFYRGLFAGTVDELEPLQPEQVVAGEKALEELPEGALICFDDRSPGLLALKERSGGAQVLWRPRPETAGTLAWRGLEIARRGGERSLPAAVPNYLRLSDAEVRFKG